MRDSVLAAAITCLIASIGLLLTAGAARAEIIDRVLAVVGGQVIMLSDVTAARELGLETSDGAADPDRAILSKLIDRQLMLVEVNRVAPQDPSIEAVDRELATVETRLVAPEAFDQVLTRSGISVNYLRQMLRDKLRIQAYLGQRFTVAEGGEARRQALIDEWLTGLRRRADIINLYRPTP